MKARNLFTAVLLAALALTASAQERTDNAPAMLSAKSLPITKATHWTQDTKTGKWESRKNTSRPYYGQGVHADNFNSIFIGEYAGQSYLFLDYFRSQWRYPHLRQDWWYYRFICQALLTEDDIVAMRELKQGETFSFRTDFYRSYFKGEVQYSPAMILTNTEKQRAAGKKDMREVFFVVKRTFSQGQDVVRFLVFPNTLSSLIDTSYFEVPYDYYMRLFTPDKKVKFK